MDSPCIKQTVCKVLNIFQHGKYLVAYVLKRIQQKRGAKLLSMQMVKLNNDNSVIFLFYSGCEEL